jgi:hypothetical protein
MRAANYLPWLGYSWPISFSARYSGVYIKIKDRAMMTLPFNGYQMSKTVLGLTKSLIKSKRHFTSLNSFAFESRSILP